MDSKSFKMRLITQAGIRAAPCPHCYAKRCRQAPPFRIFAGGIPRRRVRTNSRILHHVGNYVKITAEPHRSKPQWFNFVHHKKNPEKNTCGDRVESIGSPVRRSFSGGGNYILILLALSMVEVGEENF